jgi:hypothetical protein
MCAVFNGRYEKIIRECCLQTPLLTWVFIARYSLFKAITSHFDIPYSLFIIQGHHFSLGYSLLVIHYSRPSLLTWVFIARYSLFKGKQNLSPNSPSRFSASQRAGSPLRFDMPPAPRPPAANAVHLAGSSLRYDLLHAPC